MKRLAVPVLVLLTVLAGTPVPGVETNTASPFDSQTTLAAKTEIDRLVLAKLDKLGITPAFVCSDAVFVRRVYLDLIGTLPTAEEVKTFLSDPAPGKRGVLIDRLLERKEFADYWAMRWSDLLRVKGVVPINLWPDATQAYHRWIRTCIRENLPYDRFARELLTTSGSNIAVPQANFFRAVPAKDPSTLAQYVALTFLGERTERWPKERLDGLAAFFSQVGYKPTSQWKEEIVFWDILRTNAPTSALFPDGTTVALPADKDPRVLFADWLIAPKNPWFARNIANRVWAWLQGRGIIHEADDVGAGRQGTEMASGATQHAVGDQDRSRHEWRRLAWALLPESGVSDAETVCPGISGLPFRSGDVRGRGWNTNVVDPFPCKR